MNTITYCMNVHPGEDLASVQQALENVTIPLHKALDGETAFPMGLRFSATAAQALRTPETLQKFITFLRRNHLTTIGINGFPYGQFHQTAVKRAVYEPDWLDPRRLSYTRDLFYILAQLPEASLSAGQYTSVTTVPLAYNKGQGIEPFLENICLIALFLRKLEGFTGHRMRLALEPEPDCLLETTQGTIDFFETLWQHPLWNAVCHDYIGICFDTCHFAVNYEEPLNALRRLVQANIPIARIQVSAALETTLYTKQEDLVPFLDTTYLHQTRRREDDASLTCFEDLTDKTIPEIASRRARIHYHMPLAWEGTGALNSTRHTLTSAFWRYVRAGNWPIEIETYTYAVFPTWLKNKTLSEMLLADINWTLEQLHRA